MADWRNKTVNDRKEQQRRQDQLERERSLPKSAGIFMKDIADAKIDHNVFSDVSAGLLNVGGDGLHATHNLITNSKKKGSVGIFSEGNRGTLEKNEAKNVEKGIVVKGDENTISDNSIFR